MIDKLLLVALGGALGAVLRFASVSAIGHATGETAWGTMTVNIVGSFLMGCGVVLVLARLGTDGQRLSVFLMTGGLGAFTTFSAFSLDVFRLIEVGRSGTAALYVTGSVVLSIAALFGGVWVARQFA